MTSSSDERPEINLGEVEAETPEESSEAVKDSVGGEPGWTARGDEGESVPDDGAQ